MDCSLPEAYLSPINQYILHGQDKEKLERMDKYMAETHIYICKDMEETNRFSLVHKLLFSASEQTPPPLSTFVSCVGMYEHTLQGLSKHFQLS